jgi:hypothetical protein
VETLVSLNNIDILFRTNLFNLSKVGEHFINPSCFGEDVASWFAAKLKERGYQVSAPWQEDWGWQMSASKGADRYHLGLGGNADEDINVNDPNQGEWRIIVNKDQSFLDRIAGRDKIAVNDPLVELIENILHSESAIRGLERAS